MKKNLISAVMALAMILTVLGSYTVMAAENGVLSVTADKEFVNKGENVTYTVSLSGISDLRGMQLSLTYDADKASYVDGSFNEEAEDFADYSDFINDEGTIGFVLALAESGNYSGNVASFTLKADESASIGAVGMSVDKLIAKDSSGGDIAVDIHIDDAEIISEYSTEFSVIPDADTLNVGDEVTYMVSMSELIVKGMQFTVKYDNSYLELIEADSAGTYTMVKSEGDEGVGFIFYNKEDTSVSGDLVKLRFRVKYFDSTTEGLTPVRVDDFKAVSSEGALDVSYTDTCAPISLQKESSVEISFNADKMIAGEGETVSYTVVLNGINDYRGIQTALKYDLSKLEFVDVEPLSLMSLADASFDSAVDGTVRIACVFAETVSTTGGELAKINFRVKEGAFGTVDMSVVGTKVSADGNGYIDADYYASADEIYAYTGQLINITAEPSKSLILPGEEVVYTFKLPEVQDFKGMQFKLLYDSNAMECVDIARGAVLDGAVVRSITKTQDGVIQGMINYSRGYTGSGELFSVTFAAKNVQSLLQPELYFSSFTSDDYIVYNISPVNVYPSEPAEETINAIEAIGDVTLADKSAIEYARELYESLSAEIKERVTNYDKLTAAEQAYAELYAPVQAVIDAIEAIGEVTLDSKSELDEVNAMYNELEEDAKGYVDNYQKLADANEKYQELYDALPTYECTVGESEVSVKQNKPCEDALTMYIAQYDAAGIMTGVNIYDMAGGGVFAFTRAAETETVRCYIWDADMMPYAGAVITYNE